MQNSTHGFKRHGFLGIWDTIYHLILFTQPKINCPMHVFKIGYCKLFTDNIFVCFRLRTSVLTLKAQSLHHQRELRIIAGIVSLSTAKLWSYGCHSLNCALQSYCLGTDQHKTQSAGKQDVMALLFSQWKLFILQLMYYQNLWDTWPILQNLWRQKCSLLLH